MTTVRYLVGEVRRRSLVHSSGTRQEVPFLGAIWILPEWSMSTDPAPRSTAVRRRSTQSPACVQHKGTLTGRARRRDAGRDLPPAQ